MSAVTNQAQAKAELEAVMASGIFAKAPSLARLLEYVCARQFEGRAHEIKEYNIAVEALGRPASFDPRKDSIVRVEAFRLRKRLKTYYENDGAHHAVRIEIPPGQYVPQFAARASAEDSTAAPEHATEPIVGASAPRVSEAQIVSQSPGPAHWTRHATLLTLPVILVAAASAGALLLKRETAKPVEFSRPTAAPIVSETDEVRIAAGSAARYVDRLGNIWFPDRFFNGGVQFASPNHSIGSTPDPELFRSRREGNFSYDIPLKPGVYELHLYFAETLFGENNMAGGGETSRVFRIWINDRAVLPYFDVISDAGGSNTADERVFKDISPAADGKLHLQFMGLTNSVPILSAIEIVPGIPGRMRPVRVVTQSHNYTDEYGHVWGADRYFVHGSTVARIDPVSNTSDPVLYQGERFGNFGYTIPAAEGRYRVTLKFAETWFGPGQAAGGGPGSRIFDVYCNGAALIRNFDIYQAAGGARRAVEKSFHGIAPNAQGKIALTFVPLVNYACVNAIEVTAESN